MTRRREEVRCRPRRSQLAAAVALTVRLASHRRATPYPVLRPCFSDSTSMDDHGMKICEERPDGRCRGGGLEPRPSDVPRGPRAGYGRNLLVRRSTRLSHPHGRALNPPFIKDATRLAPRL